jgi:hypothetical protein
MRRFQDLRPLNTDMRKSQKPNTSGRVLVMGVQAGRTYQLWESLRIFSASAVRPSSVSRAARLVRAWARLGR